MGLTSEGVVGASVQQEQDEVYESQKIEMKSCHKEQHDCVQVFVES